MTETETADAPTPGAGGEARRGRSWLPGAIVALATVLAVISTLTTWVRSEVLDTDQWVDVSTSLLAEPEVQDALSTYLSERLFETVDLETQLADALPEPLDQLAGPLTGVIRQPLTEAIDRLVRSERFAALWETANREAHSRMVAILREESGPNVSTADGTVTLDLGGVLRNVGENIGVPSAALDRIPADAGQVVIFSSDELAKVQTSVQIMDFLSWFLFVVVVGLYALAVFLARGRRVAMLRTVGLSVAGGGVALLILRSLGVNAAVNVLVDNPLNEPLASVVAGVATELLRVAAWTGIVYGLLIAGFAWLIGGGARAVALRRWVGRYTESTGAVVGGCVLFVLLMLWWSPGRSFDRWVTAIVFIAATIGALVVFLRLVADERRTASAPPGGE